MAYDEVHAYDEFWMIALRLLYITLYQCLIILHGTFTRTLVLRTHKAVRVYVGLSTRRASTGTQKQPFSPFCRSPQ